MTLKFLASAHGDVVVRMMYKEGKASMEEKVRSSVFDALFLLDIRHLRGDGN